MKYFSLLLTALLILTACGKKTDTIPKDALENVQPPRAVIVRAQEEGFYIANNEDAVLYVEKAKREGLECALFNRLVVLEPKQDYLDTDVEIDKEYTYRLVKQTIKYKLTSSPREFPVVFSPPPNVADSEVVKGDDSIAVSIKTTHPFIRMDVITGGKSIIQTGHNYFTIKPEQVVNNTITLKLMDIYGNIGDLYNITFEAPKKPAEPLKDVENLTAAYLGGALRIVWDTVERADRYEVTVCEDVSCETIEAKLPFIAYEKEFDKCIDIAVQALNPEQSSNTAKYRYCR